MSHTADILGVGKKNIDRRIAGKNHIGNDRLIGRIAGEYNADTSLSPHLIIVLFLSPEYQLLGRLTLG